MLIIIDTMLGVGVRQVGDYGIRCYIYGLHVAGPKHTVHVYSGVGAT